MNFSDSDSLNYFEIEAEKNNNEEYRLLKKETQKQRNKYRKSKNKSDTLVMEIDQ